MEKITQLLSICTQLHTEHHIYGLWLDLNMKNIYENANQRNKNNSLSEKYASNVSIKLLISMSDFMSNTTIEPTMQRECTTINVNKDIKHKTKYERLYFLIQIFEEYQFNKGPLLSYRIDRNGTYGELVWLSKGCKLNGTDILTLFCKLNDYFSVQSVYLFDTSVIQLQSQIISDVQKHECFLLMNNCETDAISDGKKQRAFGSGRVFQKRIKGTKTRRAYLRVLHPICSAEYAQTWYEKKGDFHCISVNKWPILPSDPKSVNRKSFKYEMLHQNKERYDNSVEFIRDFKISDILQYLTDDERNSIQEMMDYYTYEFQFDIDTKLEYEQLTMGEMKECILDSNVMEKDNIIDDQSSINVEQRRSKRIQLRKEMNSDSKFKHMQYVPTYIRTKKIANGHVDEHKSYSDLNEYEITLEIKRLDKILIKYPITSEYELHTIHDLCRKARCNALFAPTEFCIFMRF